MKLIDRYLFRQLLGPATLAILSLTGVAVLSQSLSALDIIVNQNQSAFVFLKIILLAMPQLLSMILPIALFVAALVAFNRLYAEQEIVVCFAGGMSRWRVIAPAIRLAVLATLAALILNLWIQPYAYRQMRQELFRVRTDLAATLVQPGRFTQPSPGLTVYAKTIGAQGLLKNLFIQQERKDGSTSTFSAREGRIIKLKGAPVLIMTDGSNQEFSKSGVLNYLAFSEYSFDLSPFVRQDAQIHYKISDRYLHELAYPDVNQTWERDNRVKMLSEVHARLATPLYSIAFVIMAMAAVLGGGFSRLGYGRRIAAISGAAAVVRILGFGAQAACDDNAWLNVLQYLIPAAAAAWGLSRIFRERVSRPMALARFATVFGERAAT